MATVAPYTDRELFIKALLYGTPGVGKTTLAASAVNHPDMCPVLIISAEGGMLSVPTNDKISVIEIRNWGSEGNVPIMDRIDKIFWQLADKKLELPPYGKYKTVILDSATEILTLSLESNVKERKGDLDTLWLQDYGKATSQLKRMFRYFRDLPMHVILTCLAQDVFDGKGESAVRVAVEPALTLKLRESVKGVVDQVWYMNKTSDNDGNERYAMLTRSRGLYFAKTRGAKFAPELGQTVINPTMSAIYDLLRKTEGTDGKN